jgi:hypothetical protein
MERIVFIPAGSVIGPAGFVYWVSSGMISSTSTLMGLPSCTADLNCHFCSASGTNWACGKAGGNATLRLWKRPDLGCRY